MDLNLLTVFEAIARTSSFSAAAKELGIPKSSASRGVVRLEDELEAQIVPRFERAAGHLHLVTPEAKHVPRKVTAFQDLVLEMLKTRAGAAAPR
jgi:molybdate transport repressor ModE-like protein